jgi:CBS domain-containing protein
MGLLQHYANRVVSAPSDATLKELADLMAERAVGSVVVVENSTPVGIVTDRDLLCRAVARGLPATTRAAEVMSKPLQTASPGEPLDAVLDRMRAAGVRRMPVVNGGVLTGIVTADDVVVWLARELDDLSEAFDREIRSSRARGRRQRRREDVEQRIGEIREQVAKAGEEAWDLIGREVESLRERVARIMGREKGGDGNA